MVSNRYLWLVLSCAIFTFINPGLAYSQTAEDISRANQVGSQIQREEMLRQREEMLKNTQSEKEDTHLEVPAPKVPKGKGEGCRQINTVQISDAPIMPENVKKNIEAKYSNRCLGVDEIQSLLGIVTSYYINKGYATTRVYLPAQDLSTGTLKVQVVEGKLHEVKLDDKSKGINLKTAFPSVNGKVLNLRDIEQGLDQVNKLQSNNATIDIVPGEKTGESDIVVHNEPAKRWNMNVTTDNYGSRNTGRYQASGTAIIDNLLGLNEFYSYTHRNTLPTDGDGRDSISNSLLFAVPYGYTTVMVGYSDSTYQSTLAAPSGISLDLSGLTRSTFVTLDRTVYRTQLSKGSLSATITGKNNKNYVNGSLLSVSSHELTVLDLGGNISSRIGNKAVTFGATYSRGLNIFGAEEDLAGLPGSAPRAEFQKIGVNASILSPIKIKDRDYVLSSQLAGQVALDTLFGSEQFSIGGIYTVRGFYDETMANDHGVYLRNDISTMDTVTILKKEVQARPYLALDAGYVAGRAPGTPVGAIVGTAVGLGLSRGPVSFDVYTGHPIAQPKKLDEDGFNTFGRLSVNF